MLKMERGVAGAASRRSSRVEEMDELKRARERRASSARHPADQVAESRHETRRAPGGGRVRQDELRILPEQMEDDRPFWEKDSPFAEGGKPSWQKEQSRRGGQEERRVAPRRAEAQREAPVESRPTRELRNASREPDHREPEKRSGEPKPSPKRSQQQNPSGLKALLVLLALLALTVVIGLKVFEIQEIEVKGADTVTPDSVIALSGLAKGENIFKTSLTQARKNLESDPLVEVLGISRIFPDKIKIEIRQRKPHAAVTWLDVYAIIDERGFALDVRDSLPAGQYPLITGIDIEPAQKGSPINGVDATKMEVMEKLLTALASQGALQLVSEINLADTDELKMLTAEGLQIEMGNAADLDMKAKWVAGSIPELRKQGYTSGVLHVTGSKGPVFSKADGANQTDNGVPDASGGDQTHESGVEGADGPDNAV